MMGRCFVTCAQVRGICELTVDKEFVCVRGRRYAHKLLQSPRKINNIMTRNRHA